MRYRHEEVEFSVQSSAFRVQRSGLEIISSHLRHLRNLWIKKDEVSASPHQIEGNQFRIL
jgi:hypothetical protein